MGGNQDSRLLGSTRDKTRYNGCKLKIMKWFGHVHTREIYIYIFTLRWTNTSTDRLWSLCTCRNILNLTGHGPEQPALADYIEQGVWTTWHPDLPNSTILWFWERKKTKLKICQKGLICLPIPIKKRIDKRHKTEVNFLYEI